MILQDCFTRQIPVESCVRALTAEWVPWWMGYAIVAVPLVLILGIVFLLLAAMPIVAWENWQQRRRAAAYAWTSTEPPDERRT